VAAMKQKDWDRFGELMYQSHDSLRDDFEVSCKELDLLVTLAQEIDVSRGVLGARMTGGGFGGCMVALIEREKADEIIETLSSGYHDLTARELTAYVSSPAAGARLLSQEELESL
jgi:galactokinase